MIGKLSKQILGLDLPVKILRSNAGFYIGTHDGVEPISRESVEYWPTEQLAATALDNGTWTQRQAL